MGEQSRRMGVFNGMQTLLRYTILQLLKIKTTL